MSIIRTVILGLALFIGAAAGSPASEEKELADDLIKQLVGFSRIALSEMDPAMPGVCYAKMPNEHNQTPCYPLAYLYKTKHPLNPYYGDTEIRDQAIAICDHIVKVQSTLEWPLYSLSQVYALLEDELNGAHKKSWLDYATYYMGTRGSKPYFYTSFNHEAWNATAILRAGQVFGNAEWVDRALRLMYQLIKVQNELGYFDEGPHHGPSMKYNQTQLAPMLLFADYSGDEKVLAASKKLADFMIRYSFPDGSPIGCFDGRQSWSIGYYGALCYGLDRWAVGKEHNRRIWRTKKRWGMLDPQAKYYNLSDWYAYFGFGFLLDEYLSLKPDAPSSALPQDFDGYLRYEQGSSFAGGVARSHGWMVALSAINSDIPRVAQSVYRLERQSRLDVWNEKTGLIIGGGHNIRETEVPLANFHLVTGYEGVDCDFGRLSGGQWHDRRALYIPRAVEADIALERQILRESYGQGDVAFNVVPLDEHTLRIVFDYDVFTTKKLIVQLPLIVYYNSSVSLDGYSLTDKDKLHNVREQVDISNPLTGTLVRIVVPEGLQAALRPPILPLRWYGGDHGVQRYEPFYEIRLLSVMVENPKGKGSGEFTVTIRKL